MKDFIRSRGWVPLKDILHAWVPAAQVNGCLYLLCQLNGFILWRNPPSRRICLSTRCESKSLRARCKSSCNGRFDGKSWLEFEWNSAVLSLRSVRSVCIDENLYPVGSEIGPSLHKPTSRENDLQTFSWRRGSKGQPARRAIESLKCHPPSPQPLLLSSSPAHRRKARPPKVCT